VSVVACRTRASEHTTQRARRELRRALPDRPDRRESHPHSATLVLTVPAFGPWDGRAATSCSDVFELRFPAARGDSPYVPKMLNWLSGAAQAEDAYRVGESRSNYPSVIPGRPNCLLITSWSKWKTPHLRSAQVGRLKRSLD
jgi:hypothetical protein